MRTQTQDGMKHRKMACRIKKSTQSFFLIHHKQMNVGESVHMEGEHKKKDTSALKWNESKFFFASYNN